MRELWGKLTRPLAWRRRTVVCTNLILLSKGDPPRKMKPHVSVQVPTALVAVATGPIPAEALKLKPRRHVEIRLS